MSFDLQRILESKRAYRRGLASRPIAEKLRMLDTLRERGVVIRGRRVDERTEGRAVREESQPYRRKSE